MPHSWKMRFLVKVDQLLYSVVRAAVDALLSPGERRDDRTPSLQAQYEHDSLMSASTTGERWYKGSDDDIIVAEATIRRIRNAVGETMAYMVETLLKKTLSQAILLPDAAAGDLSHYYVMITLCYVVRNYPKARWCWQDELEQDTTQTTRASADWGLSVLASRLPSRRTSPGLHRSHAGTRVRTTMLEWLHHESIFSLQQDFLSGSVIPSEWHYGGTFVLAGNARQAAKSELMRKIAYAHSYRPDDEVEDRLAFLSQEMWPDLDEAEQIANRVTKRIEERDVTRTIDLCRFDPGQERSAEGPWELHALCHHSRFVVAVQKMYMARRGGGEVTEERVEHYRKLLYPFFTSEASVTPSWKRDSSSARRGFFASEATAVVGSTLIEICYADMELFRHQEQADSPWTAGSRPTIRALGAGSHLGQTASVDSDGPFPGAGETDRLVARAYLREKEDNLFLRQLKTLVAVTMQKDLGTGIDYLQFRPPQRYHPSEFFKSLDDTPELYEDAAMQERELKMHIVVRDMLAERVRPSDDREAVAGKPSVWGRSSDGIEELMAMKGAKRLRELLVGKWSSPIEADNIRLAAEQLRRLAVIDLTTPDPLPLSRPKPIRDGRIVGMISDSVSLLSGEGRDGRLGKIGMLTNAI